MFHDFLDEDDVGSLRRTSELGHVPFARRYIFRDGSRFDVVLLAPLLFEDVPPN
jgi:hypothetical protein